MEEGRDASLPPNHPPHLQQQAPETSLASPSFTLADHITQERFSKIMADFNERRQQTLQGNNSNQGLGSTLLQTTKMTTEDFQEAMSRRLGRPPDDPKIMLLCKKIDADGLGFIDADEFCSYLLQQLKERDTLSQLLAPPIGTPPRYRHNMCSKESICRICLANGPLRFISISKDGGMATWNLQLHFQRGSMLDPPATARKGRGTEWVTDFAVLANCNKVVLSTTSRELVFGDTSTPNFKCQFRVQDLPFVPICLEYYTNPESPGSKCYLLYGDVSGSVAVFTFHAPLTGLFSTPKKKDDDDKPTVIGFWGLGSHSRFVSLQYISHLHSDWVTQVTYVPHNHTFISCSSSPTDSLIVRDIDHKINNYVFKNRKGVTCFDYSHPLDLLVTGSLDHMVCLWNPYVPSKPVAVLAGHSTTILAVVIAEEHNLIFSLSQDLVLCAWHIFEYILLQTMTLKFPFTQRQNDFGPRPMSFLPAAQSLAITCNEHVARLHLGPAVSRTSSDGTVFTSHQHPMCAAVYNRLFRQVVSGCEGGVVKVWDVESGNQVLRLTDCHGGNELTAMTLDATGRRLVTGSRAGDVKVWQYMHSTCVKHLQKDGYSEVTGIVHILERGLFLSVGWDKKITTFRDEPDVFDVVPDQSWNGEVHVDDILCVSYSPPHYLVTGSFDGTIKVWNTDLERLLTQFRSFSKSKLWLMKKNLRKSSEDNVDLPMKSWVSFRSASSSRPGSRRMAKRDQYPKCSQHVPVDQVILLPRRIQSRDRGCSAVLITSEAGMAKFWDLFGHKRPIGSFPLTELDEECVLAMKVDSEEKHLVAGDSAGYIAVFDIGTYCTTAEGGGNLMPSVRWRAHSMEVVSIDFVPHENQPLVLSSSGDGTVRLWTMSSHFIGTFGQERPWDLKSPATFQHPSTPWGGMWRSNSGRNSAASIRIASRAGTPAPTAGEQLASIPEGQDLKEQPIGEKRPSVAMEMKWPSVSSISSVSSSELPPSLVDKTLGEPYAELTHKRMDDRQKRRVHLSEIGLKSAADKFDSVFSPFHSLEISRVEDVPMPKELFSMFGNRRASKKMSVMF